MLYPKEYAHSCYYYFAMITTSAWSSQLQVLLASVFHLCLGGDWTTHAVLSISGIFQRVYKSHCDIILLCHLNILMNKSADLVCLEWVKVAPTSCRVWRLGCPTLPRAFLEAGHWIIPKCFLLHSVNSFVLNLFWQSSLSQVQKWVLVFCHVSAAVWCNLKRAVY